MNRLLRWLGKSRLSPPQSSVAMTEDNVTMSFRIYWTKIARSWELDRIRACREAVLKMTEAPEFQKNLIERRYRVSGLDEQAHSGASLVALLEVLEALETYSMQSED